MIMMKCFDEAVFVAERSLAMDENMQPIERVKAEKPKRHIFRRILCFLLALLLGLAIRGVIL